ncbi:uncharacterized protein AB675_1136 [Cyphellophora attinorum]|uniref:Cyanovirin-N domain-containing protein n=1 Tax=Cyphellophora attinorum TaxID=1664694 RepID=A0A0N1H1P1_9EURO|nr:uncharacterized protein AB675_1136 [Phialophora attinorum]KPI38097.1 hypothetical protein AB675_1136 [Phialophora attinorum]
MKATALVLTALPLLASSATLQVNLFSEPDCKGSKQTFTIGNLESCHKTQGFKSYGTSNVDQSFFNRELRLSTWSTEDCRQSATITIGEGVALTNQNNCHEFGAINDPKSLEPGARRWTGRSFYVGG